MTDKQWQTLLAVINGELAEPMPVGFIIDSPWLPAWTGISTLDYFFIEQLWVDANLRAVRQFPDAIFLPGFWAEFGMCTEPSAFGAKCSWHENELPYAGKIISDIQSAASLGKPNPATDGLLPFVLNRLKRCRAQIEAEGHRIRFAVSRGPLNIASFLLGTTEFLMAIRTDPDLAHKLLETVTDFIIDWLGLQISILDSIDGVFILDDIAGFLGEQDFTETAMPYLKRIFESFQTSVKFFHNDAPGLVCAPHLADIGVNLFNFSFQHSLAEMKQLTGNAVTLLGNIPTRDVLASGSPQEVRDSVKAAMQSAPERSRIILSCGGGMPPGVPTQNIEAFLDAAGRI